VPVLRIGNDNAHCPQRLICGQPVLGLFTVSFMPRNESD
jgi:hypothetical protein